FRAPPRRRPLHSFPTRRSSDLKGRLRAAFAVSEPGFDGVPDEGGEVAAAEALDLLNARGRGDVDLGEPVADHVDADEDQAHLLQDRKSTRLNSSHVKISYAVFC